MQRQILDCLETEERKQKLQEKVSLLLKSTENESFFTFIGGCKKEHVLNRTPEPEREILPGQFIEKQLCYDCENCSHEIAVYLGVGKGCNQHVSDDVMWFLSEGRKEPFFDDGASLTEANKSIMWAILI